MCLQPLRLVFPTSNRLSYRKTWYILWRQLLILYSEKLIQKLFTNTSQLNAPPQRHLWCGTEAKAIFGFTNKRTKSTFKFSLPWQEADDFKLRIMHLFIFE